MLQTKGEKMSFDGAQNMIGDWIEKYAIDENADDRYAQLKLTPTGELEVITGQAQALCDIVMILHELTQTDREYDGD